MTIRDRIKLWREDAACMRRRGSRRAAALMERLAAELEDDHCGGSDDDDGEQVPELVELRAAVALSGYTRGHLRMLVARTLTNYGTDARPLIRASDLPRKPRRPEHMGQANPSEKKGRTGGSVSRGSFLGIDASTRGSHP